MSRVWTLTTYWIVRQDLDVGNSSFFRLGAVERFAQWPGLPVLTEFLPSNPVFYIFGTTSYLRDGAGTLQITINSKSIMCSFAMIEWD